MTEREKKDFSSENRNNDHGVWKQQTPSSSSLHQQAPLLPNQLSNPAKPVSSLLAIWSSRERKRATGSHAEFAGRVNFIGRPAKLYSAANTHVSRWVEIILCLCRRIYLEDGSSRWLK